MAKQDPAPQITVLRWADFQHYKHRRPPWVKLHRQLLENRRWFALSPDASKLLVECWLVASDTSAGAINGNAADLAFRLHRNPDEITSLLQELAVQGFIELHGFDASNVLAGCCPRVEKSRVEKSNNTSKSAVAKEKRKKPTEYPPGFLAVWALHPRGAKGEALKEWRRAVPELIADQPLRNALEAYCRTLRADFQGMHLFRWLRDERWEEHTARKTGNTMTRKELDIWET